MEGLRERHPEGLPGGKGFPKAFEKALRRPSEGLPESLSEGIQKALSKDAPSPSTGGISLEGLGKALKKAAGKAIGRPSPTQAMNPLLQHSKVLAKAIRLPLLERTVRFYASSSRGRR